MRTTIRLDQQLLIDAKQFATRTGRTLTGVIEDALRQALAEAKRSKKSGSARIPTVRGNGLQPGVDLDDTAALLSVMDESR